MEKKILKSLYKFTPDLKDKVVLTEAATGNYRVTPLIAALAGARVYAFTKNSKYGLVEEVQKQTLDLAKKLNVEERISVITDIDEVDLKKVEILTNTGFLRPINERLISKLSAQCVIPLMWEPWEFRKGELDIEACYRYGIKVYGTDESDQRLRTMEYIGFVVLSFLLDNKLSPFSSYILLVGCDHFVKPTENVLRQNHYKVLGITDYRCPVGAVNDFDAIVVLEHERTLPIIGSENAFINRAMIDEHTLVIHICGNVSLNGAKFNCIPKKPKPFGHMSFTADFIDSQAVIDLHTAGLKVAEGMLKANKIGLNGSEYKIFMEKNYPALAFEDSRFW